MLNAPLAQWWKLVEHATTAAALRFLRQTSRPIAPRLVVKRSNDANSNRAVRKARLKRRRRTSAVGAQPCGYFPKNTLCHASIGSSVLTCIQHFTISLDCFADTENIFSCSE